ncbi:hypothetical protein [Pelotomaculum propionicicum]|uniref:PIN domain-containing protein n=1 Tax=Pelotomaculum propionicicum TaxID=258475 RepID=A0A4Y7RYG5_9FIRM|nr:hypothetical protein [Pelotomaculum propionicicum]TEB13779.1 hypothetical protein Pmgp_00187 [Pelotomaculum propionicicum]
MRQVHFVDTSILCCLLRVPKFCDDKYMEVEEELLSIINRSETLILPIASIIETGNHIAHISAGNTRRLIAQKFAQYLRDTADNKAPWSLINLEWTPDDLRKFAEMFPDQAMRQVGFGDMSIIDAYEDYIRRTPGVSVRIWTTDKHLMAYRHDAPVIGRRSRC